jgi:acyl-CoA synthetase (AMP-forming)/AMP-acid ligase II
MLQLEEALTRNGAISECAVVADSNGELVAVMVLQPGMNVSAADLIRFLSEHHPGSPSISRFSFQHEALARDGSGSIRRESLLGSI